MSWADGPLAGFDLETTGTDPENARIVTACIAFDVPGEKPVTFTWLADPGVPIPDDAAGIHGITTERAQAEGHPEWEVTSEILLTLQNHTGTPVTPLVVYNAPYDLTLLDRAARRYHRLYDTTAGWHPRRPVIDPLVLEKHFDRYRRGSRKLADVCAHYGIPFTGAHDAEADTLAAIRLARKLASAFPSLGRMNLREIWELQVAAKAEQARSLQKHFKAKGSDEVVDGSWPLRPWGGEEEAA